MAPLWRFLTSLRTCAWAGLAFTLSGIAGSLFLGWFPSLFGDMDASILSTWFAAKGTADPAATLWLYGLLAATGLMAVNAACCTYERLLKIFRGKATLRRLLPHVMHLAFLGVVCAHLVSSVSGERHRGILVPQGKVAAVPGSSTMYVGPGAGNVDEVVARVCRRQADVDVSVVDTTYLAMPFIASKLSVQVLNDGSSAVWRSGAAQAAGGSGGSFSSAER